MFYINYLSKFLILLIKFNIFLILIQVFDTNRNHQRTQKLPQKENEQTDEDKPKFSDKQQAFEYSAVLLRNYHKALRAELAKQGIKI